MLQILILSAVIRASGKWARLRLQATPVCGCSTLLRYPAVSCYGILATVSYSAFLQYPTVLCCGILQSLATVSYNALLRYPTMRCYGILQSLATQSYSALPRYPTMLCYGFLQRLAMVSFSPLLRYPAVSCYGILQCLSTVSTGSWSLCNVLDIEKKCSCCTLKIVTICQCNVSQWAQSHIERLLSTLKTSDGLCL